MHNNLINSGKVMAIGMCVAISKGTTLENVRSNYLVLIQEVILKLFTTTKILIEVLLKRRDIPSQGGSYSQGEKNVTCESIRDMRRSLVRVFIIPYNS